MSFTIGLKDKEEINKTFNKLVESGEIEMKLGKTFFSELFGMVTDKFGIIWQISKIPEPVPKTCAFSAQSISFETGSPVQ
ncbi:MAG: VOC family protein [Treponema sp.]|nr:VOC family protein [Treponema sp.]